MAGRTPYKIETRELLRNLKTAPDPTTRAVYEVGAAASERLDRLISAVDVLTAELRRRR